MKRLIPLLFMPFLLVLFGGNCETEPEEAIQPPSNLVIEVTGTDNLSIKLTWDASPTANIDGYKVIFEGVVLDNVTNAQFIHDHPTELGDYRVKAYKGDRESSSITGSTELIIADNQGPVWWFDAPTDTGYSAYGWDEDGTGSLYSFVVANKDSIDFYMDSVSVAKGTDKMISPDAWWDDAHATWFNTTSNTGDVGFTNTAIAPEFGVGAYYNYAELTATGIVYILYLDSDHYLKLLVKSRKVNGHHNFVFKYGFQPIAGFRRIGND